MPSCEVRPLAPDVLCVMVSGGRPGGVKARPTEKYIGPSLVISNNPTGYETALPIVEPPQAYRDWYADNHALSEYGTRLPMSRSYALDYAREHGYRYCIQVDDNIVNLHLKHLRSDGSTYYSGQIRDMTPFLNALADVLRFTNAGLAGLNIASVSIAQKPHLILAERYVYSILALDVDVCPPFWGDMEDDIGMRLQLAQRGIPTVQILPLRYGKTGQLSSGDKTGARSLYDEVGRGRGDTMALIYGDKYRRGVSDNFRNITRKPTRQAGQVLFKHRLTPFKVGVRVSDNVGLNRGLAAAFAEIKMLAGEGPG